MWWNHISGIVYDIFLVNKMLVESMWISQ